MKTHEQINYACSKGLYPIVQKKNGVVCIFSPHKDIDGDYRYSDWFDTQEQAGKCIGYLNGYTPESMERYSQRDNWKIIGYYDTPYEGYEVGESVAFADGSYAGKIKSVKTVHGKYIVFYTLDDSSVTEYAPCQLFPYFDTTPSEEEIEKAKKTLEDAGLLVDGKILAYE